MEVRTSIGRDSSAYRRGVVLGLTMAEVMLLLVFCLLIAASVVFHRDRRLLDDMESKLATQTAELWMVKGQRDRLAELVEAARHSSPNPDPIADDWKKLLASEAVVRRMEEAGLHPDEIANHAGTLTAVEPLLSQGVSGSEIAAAVINTRKLQAKLKGQGLSDASPSELTRLAAIGRDAEKAGRGAHDWPPIINLSEAGGYNFATGSAELSRDFDAKLKSSILRQLIDIIQQYDVDVVEVIGHTDEQPLSERRSNLDAKLITALNGRADALAPADNAGLGMARAVSVVKVLRADPRLRNVTVLPLSAAQVILPGDSLSDGQSAGDVKERRRIEIRVRRSNIYREQ